MHRRGGASKIRAQERPPLAGRWEWGSLPGPQHPAATRGTRAPSGGVAVSSASALPGGRRLVSGEGAHHSACLEWVTKPFPKAQPAGRGSVRKGTLGGQWSWTHERLGGSAWGTRTCTAGILTLRGRSGLGAGPGSGRVPLAAGGPGPLLLTPTSLRTGQLRRSQESDARLPADH